MQVSVMNNSENKCTPDVTIKCKLIINKTCWMLKNVRKLLGKKLNYFCWPFQALVRKSVMQKSADKKSRTDIKKYICPL